MGMEAVGNGGRVTSIAVETVRKTNDVAKTEGKAMVKLINDADKVAKSLNNDSGRGRIIDIRA